MSGHPAEIDRIVAAEFVLGTLDRDERRRVRIRCAGDPQFAALVRLWERRLSPLHELAVPVTPPPVIWRTIADDLRSASPAPRGVVASRNVPPLPDAVQRPGSPGRTKGPAERASDGATARLKRVFSLGFGTREPNRAPTAESRARRSHFPSLGPAPGPALAPVDLLMPEGRTLSGAIRDAVAAGLLPEAGAGAPSRANDLTHRLPPPLKIAPARQRARPEPLKPPPAFIFLEPEPPPEPSAPEPSAPTLAAPEPSTPGLWTLAKAMPPDAALPEEPAAPGDAPAASHVVANVAPAADGTSLQGAAPPVAVQVRAAVPPPVGGTGAAASLEAASAKETSAAAAPDHEAGSSAAAGGEPMIERPAADPVNSAGAVAPEQAVEPASVLGTGPDGSAPQADGHPPSTPGAAEGPANDPPSADPAAGGEAAPLPGWATEVASGEVSSLPEGAEVVVGRPARRGLPWRGIALGLAATCLVLGARAAWLEWYWPGGGHWVGIAQPEPLPVVVVRIDPDSGAVFVRSFAPAPPEGDIYRLWLVSPGSGARLLGAFSAGLAVRVPDLDRRGLSASELLVTREPAGRAATPADGPAESVLYRGRLAPE